MELLSKMSDKQLEKIYKESKELQQAIMKERLKRAGRR